MPNIGVVLRAEITRVAARVTRQEIQPIRSSSAFHRKQIAALRKQLQDLHKQVVILTRELKKAGREQPQEEVANIRFSAKGLLTKRNQLGLSQKDFGRLIGVSEQTIGNWESEHTHPRAGQLPSIAAVRKLGKREALAKLDSF